MVLLGFLFHSVNDLRTTRFLHLIKQPFSTISQKSQQRKNTNLKGLFTLRLLALYVLRWPTCTHWPKQPKWLRTANQCWATQHALVWEAFNSVAMLFPASHCHFMNSAFRTLVTTFPGILFVTKSSQGIIVSLETSTRVWTWVALRSLGSGSLQPIEEKTLQADMLVQRHWRSH